MDDGAGGLADLISRQSQAIFEDVAPQIERLSRIAVEMKMPQDTHDSLRDSLEGLRRPTFTLAVFGHFSAGKSTLLNALLGRLERPLPELKEGYGAPLPMDRRASSPRVTVIRHGEIPSVDVVYDDERRETWSLGWFVKNAVFQDIRKRDEERLAGIARYELTYPFENGRAGIVLIDTPGIEDATNQTLAAARACGQADAAIVLFNGDQLGGQQELQFVQDMAGVGLDTQFLVVNRMYGAVVDDAYRQWTWDRLVTTMRSGPDYIPDGFDDQRIYFVDVKAALDGRLQQDAGKLRESGMEAFEAALARFFETERRVVKMTRWTGLAIEVAEELQRRAQDAIPSLTTDREKFQAAFEAAQPDALALQSRKGQPALLFDRFRRRAVDGLEIAFQRFVSSVADDLPAALATAKLASLADVASVISSSFDPAKKAQVAREAAALVNDYFRQRLHAWESAAPPQDGVRKVLEPITEDLMGELRREITRTERAFEQIRFSLSDSLATMAVALPDGVQGDSGKWWDRIAPTAARLLFGAENLDAAAGLNWKTFDRQAMSQIGSLIAAAVLRGVAAPFALAGWIAKGFEDGQWKGFDPQREAKEQAIAAFAEGARAQVAAARQMLETEIRAMTRDFEGAVVQAYAREIEDQLANLMAMQQLNALGRDERAAEIERFTRLMGEIDEARARLSHARALAPIG